MTDKALEQSIAHWEANVAAETPEDASTSCGDCALCDRYFGNACFRCPVAAHTKKSACRGTPYAAAALMLEDWCDAPDNDALRDAWRTAAQAEVDFLKSLRK